MGHPDPRLQQPAGSQSREGNSPAAEHLPTLLTSVDKRGQGGWLTCPGVIAWVGAERPWPQ